MCYYVTDCYSWIWGYHLAHTVRTTCSNLYNHLSFNYSAHSNWSHHLSCFSEVHACSWCLFLLIYIRVEVIVKSVTYIGSLQMPGSIEFYLQQGPGDIFVWKTRALVKNFLASLSYVQKYRKVWWPPLQQIDEYYIIKNVRKTALLCLIGEQSI